MASILPSQIVEYIDANVQKGWSNALHEVLIGSDVAVPILLGLLDLVERVPAHLITLGSEDFAQLLANLAVIRAGVRKAGSGSI
jgi:hypothetical protein